MSAPMREFACALPDGTACFWSWPGLCSTCLAQAAHPRDDPRRGHPMRENGPGDMPRREVGGDMLDRLERPAGAIGLLLRECPRAERHHCSWCQAVLDVRALVEAVRRSRNPNGR